MKKTKYILVMITILIKIIGDFFKLTYTQNDGAAFGIFGGRTIFILLISVLILIYLLYELFRNKRQNFLMDSSISLIIGGLLGNLIDRIYFGYVRDFLDFTIFNYDFAIFNIGDIAIVIGAFTFFICIIREGKYENKNN